MAIYEDAGVSGALFLGRPGLQAALKDIEDSKADVLIVYSMSRLSRDTEHQGIIRRRLKLVGASLVFCDMEVSNTPEGVLQTDIMGTFAQYERNVIRDRTKRGRRRAAQEKGIQTQTFMRPWGYYLPNKKDVLLGNFTPEQRGKYLIVEEEAQWVRAIFGRLAGGESLHAVARWLNEQGVATPRNGQYWRCSTLKRIVNNPVYMGQGVHGRHEKRHDHTLLEKEHRPGQMYTQPFVVRETEPDRWVYIDAPALVEEHTWETCQRLLTENRKRHGGRPDRKYTLTGLLRCPNCDRTMTASKRMQKPSPSRIANHCYKPLLKYVYTCKDSRPSRNTGGHTCNPRNYNGTKAEAAVFAGICYVAQHPEALEAALRAHQQAPVPSFDAAAYRRLEIELRELTQREQATVEAQIRGVLVGANISVYDNVLREIAVRRTQVENALQAAQGQRARFKTRTVAGEAQAITDALRAVEEALSAAGGDISDNDKRGLLMGVVEAVYPTDDLETYVLQLKPFSTGRVGGASEDAQTVPTIRQLWPPAAATSRARLTAS